VNGALQAANDLVFGHFCEIAHMRLERIDLHQCTHLRVELFPIFQEITIITNFVALIQVAHE
jgi:hypothetical protein